MSDAHVKHLEYCYNEMKYKLGCEITRLRAEVEQVNALYQDLGAEAVKLHDRISELEAALKVAREALLNVHIIGGQKYADEAVAAIDEALK